MHIALLVTDLQRGGTPMRLVRTAFGLRDGGVRVTVGCLAPRGPLNAELEAAGIPTFACDARKARALSTLWRLSRHLRDIRPDLIHATLTHANICARIVGRRLKIPVLTSTATIEVERRWHRVAERWTAGMDCGHVVGSEVLATHVVQAFGLPRKRVHVVPPPPPPVPRRIERAAARRELGLPDEAFVVAWAGRLDPVKRVELAIAAIESGGMDNALLVLAGEGADRARIEGLRQRSAARERVRLLGWQDDLGPLFSAADAFVFPSLTEGRPNAVVQALGFGLPVVASDIPAMRELAGEPPCLVLVGGGDGSAYAAALRRLRNDAAERAALERLARERFGGGEEEAEKAIRALIGVYEGVLR